MKQLNLIALLLILTFIICIGFYNKLYASAMRKVRMQTGLGPKPIIENLVKANITVALCAGILVTGFIILSMIIR